MSSGKPHTGKVIAVVAWILILTLSWFGLEIGSYVVLRFHDRAKAPSLFSHPLVTGFKSRAPEAKIESFDPYLAHRYVAGAVHLETGVSINEYGLVHNGQVDVAPTERSDYKVMLLGGSSMADLYASSNKATIAAQLEIRLRRDTKRFGSVVAINAGVGGYYSPLELTYFVMELVHYKPNAVVVLDGFNDFWHSFVQSSDSAHDGDWAVPNRTNYQQMILDHIEGGGVADVGILRKDSIFAKVFYFSTAFIRMTAAVSAEYERQAIHQSESNPWRHNARAIREDIYHSPSHVPYMVENWLSIIGAARARDMDVVILLQPVLPVNGRTLTTDEKQHYDKFFSDRPEIDRATYEATMQSFYATAQTATLDLIRKFARDPHVKIEDISQLGHDMPESMFIDTVHYTDRGHEIIAEHIEEILSEMKSNAAFPNEH